MGVSSPAVLRLKLPCDFSLLHWVLQSSEVSLFRGAEVHGGHGAGCTPGAAPGGGWAYVCPADQCGLHLDLGVHVTGTS